MIDEAFERTNPFPQARGEVSCLCLVTHPDTERGHVLQLPGVGAASDGVI